MSAYGSVTPCAEDQDVRQNWQRCRRGAFNYSEIGSLSARNAARVKLTTVLTSLVCWSGQALGLFGWGIQRTTCVHVV